MSATTPSASHSAVISKSLAQTQRFVPLSAPDTQSFVRSAAASGIRRMNEKSSRPAPWSILNVSKTSPSTRRLTQRRSRATSASPT